MLVTLIGASEQPGQVAGLYAVDLVSGSHAYLGPGSAPDVWPR